MQFQTDVISWTLLICEGQNTVMQ